MPDEASREIVGLLLNAIEDQQIQIEGFKEEVQKLRDEISRLKGEQGKPVFSAKKAGKDISSPREPVTKSKGEQKGKKANLEIDKRVRSPIDRSILPPDAVFKGYEKLVQQDLVFKRENTEFEIEVWYSPSEKKTYRSQAEGYEGQFGNSLKSFVLLMHHYADASHGKLLGLLEGMEIKISAGTIQNILVGNKEMWLDEKRDILRAGLSQGYTQTDTTGAKVAGQGWHTHVLCSESFAVFSTQEGKGRKYLLHALQGEPESGLMLAHNETTVEYLDHFKVSKAHKAQLATIFDGRAPLNESEFREEIIRLMPDLASKPTTFNWVCDSFAFGHYHHQAEYPTVGVLVSDDAPEYKLIGKKHGLCWIHDARHYNRLTPFVDCHRKIADGFQEQYWGFYRSLSAYRENPNEKQRQALEHQFDCLFNLRTQYFNLDQAIERTLNNKSGLLAVLDCPEIPLHNNLSELMARVQVRKRDICLHTMTRIGTQMQDALMSVIHTCKLHRQNAFAYIRDRISAKNTFYLPDLVSQKINSS